MSTRAIKRAPQLLVRRLSASSKVGWLVCGSLKMRCALGRSGIRPDKREGDGATPAGRWKLIQVFYRSDRSMPPRTALSVHPITTSDGWCDAAGDRNYNRLVRLPYKASHEHLVRTDDLYDIVVLLSHNRRPRIQGQGSAIFFHLMGPAATPTAGCIAVAHKDMLMILEHCGRRTHLRVFP